jgi:predicted TIM-barrel fold metal-dependent hydrolase
LTKKACVGYKLASMRFVDPHVHWWDRANPRFVTATQEQADAFGLGDVSGMDRDYGRAEYLADAARADAAVAKVVWVTATINFAGQVEEVGWIDRTTAGDPLLAAIVGGIDPTLPRAEWRANFDAQAAAERFRGIRILAGLAYESTTADEVMRMLADRGCVYDLVSHHETMAAAARLAERHPEVPFVLEHAGWPQRPEDAADVAAWRAGIEALAAVETVSCKISGLAMSLHSFGLEAQRPFVEHCLEAFGPTRCMFASNFPVDALYGGFEEMFGLYESLTADLDATTRELLFAGNAERIYRI